MTNYEQVNDSTEFSILRFSKKLGIGGLCLQLAQVVLVHVAFKSMFNTPASGDAYEFYGKVQPGITTPTQKHAISLR
ncbi:hypothetical protein ACVPOW_13965 [Staphylococcus aureus]